MGRAKQLFDVYFTHLHPYLPLLDREQSAPSTIARRNNFLFNASEFRMHRDRAKLDLFFSLLLGRPIAQCCALGSTERLRSIRNGAIAEGKEHRRRPRTSYLLVVEVSHFSCLRLSG
jgi:hypothetical protein